MIGVSESCRNPVGILSVFLTGGLLALAPAPGSAEEMLFRCYFDWMCDPNRTYQDAGLDIRYRLDTETNQATRIGHSGPGRIDAVIGDRAVTFVETPISGGLSTTTVLLGSGDAVHSTHAIDGVTMTPLQYLGNCVAM